MHSMSPLLALSLQQSESADSNSSTESADSNTLGIFEYKYVGYICFALLYSITNVKECVC